MENATVKNDSRLNPSRWKKPEWVKKVKEELKNAPASDAVAINDPEHYEGSPAPENSQPSEQNAPADQTSQDNVQTLDGKAIPAAQKLKGNERLREELEKIKDKFNPSRAKDKEKIECKSKTVDEVIGDFETNKLTINSPNLRSLEARVEDIPDSDPDKGYYMAREALILTRTDKKNNVERAKKLFEDAKKLSPADVRISMLEAGFNIMLGDYDSAIKIYEGAVKEAKKSGKSCDLEAISYELMRFDVLLNSEITSAQSEKKKETLKGLLTVLKIAVNPQSIVDLVIGEIVSDALFVERKEHKPDELAKFKDRVDELAKKSVEDLAKTGDTAALIDLSNKVFGEYQMMNKKIDAVQQEREKQGIPSDMALAQTKNSYTSFLTYFYPLIVENTIKAAKDNKDFKTLAALGDNLCNLTINIPPYSSNAAALRERYADLTEKAYAEAIELTNDKDALFSIGGQLLAIGKYKTALKAFEKLAAGMDKPPVILGYAYLAAGEKEKAKKVFETSSPEELSMLNSGKCADFKVNGAELSGEDALKLRGILKLLMNYPKTAQVAIVSFFYGKGRIVTPESMNVENNVLTLNVNELKIKEIKINGEKKNKKLAEWIQYLAFGKLSAGKPFDVNELNAAMARTSSRLGTFDPSTSDWKWWIEEENGEAVVYVDLNERMRKYVEAGFMTATSGKDDIRGVANFKWKFASGRDLGLSLSAGALDGKTVVDGSISFYDPDLIEINDKKYFTDISVFKNSYINYMEDRNEEMTGAGIKMGTEIGKNTNIWVNPKAYGVQDGGSAIGIVDLYAGLTYDSRIDNKGTFFSIYGGPGFSPDGGFFKTQATAMQYIPLPEGGTLVIKGIAGAGNGLPSNEMFVLGKDQHLFHGLLSDPKIGNVMLIGGAEVRSKIFDLGAGFKVQPYLYVDAGATSELSKMHFKFVPWGGAGIRICSPVIGWVNLFFGWPLVGTTGSPQFGFTFDDPTKP